MHTSGGKEREWKGTERKGAEEGRGGGGGRKAGKGRRGVGEKGEGRQLKECAGGRGGVERMLRKSVDHLLLGRRRKQQEGGEPEKFVRTFQQVSASSRTKLGGELKKTTAHAAVSGGQCSTAEVRLDDKPKTCFDEARRI